MQWQIQVLLSNLWKNPQHNVDVCIDSALAKAIEENRYNSLFCRVILFCGQQCLALREDIMVTKKFLSINEGIQLAEHRSAINASHPCTK